MDQILPTLYTGSEILQLRERTRIDGLFSISSRSKLLADARSLSALIALLSSYKVQTFFKSDFRFLSHRINNERDKLRTVLPSWCESVCPLLSQDTLSSS